MMHLQKRRQGQHWPRQGCDPQWPASCSALLPESWWTGREGERIESMNHTNYVQLTPWMQNNHKHLDRPQYKYIHNYCKGWFTIQCNACCVRQNGFMYVYVGIDIHCVLAVFVQCIVCKSDLKKYTQLIHNAVSYSSTTSFITYTMVHRWLFTSQPKRDSRFCWRKIASHLILWVWPLPTIVQLC